jgi:hypothetical protein
MGVAGDYAYIVVSRSVAQGEPIGPSPTSNSCRSGLAAQATVLSRSMDSCAQVMGAARRHRRAAGDSRRTLRRRWPMVAEFNRFEIIATPLRDPPPVSLR